MTNPYPAVITDANGNERLGVSIDFTDAANRPGGGPGNVVVSGPYSFAYNTANLNTGVAFYTPTVGDIFLDLWIEVTTAFNGTTPLADVGPFANAGDGGWWANFSRNGAVDLTHADADAMSPTGSIVLSQSFIGNVSPSDLVVTNLQSAVSLATAKRLLPGRFVAATPLVLVVSQDGLRGGTAVGGSAGAGRVYVITATPTAFT